MTDLDHVLAPDEPAVGDYIARLPDPVKRADSETLVRLGRMVTGEPARMWGKSIVGFGQYRYRYESGREGDSPLFSFAPRARAHTLYLCSSGIETFQPILDRLGTHRTGTGCLYVARLADVDLTVLQELVEAAIADTRTRYPVSSER